MWHDKSGENNDATQITLNKQPQFIDSVVELNNKPVLRFDGVDDFMEFPELTNILTAIVVVKHSSGSSATPQTLIGHGSKYDFLGFSDSLLFNSFWLNQGIKDGLVLSNGVSYP